jgi:hypothetical protein
MKASMIIAAVLALTCTARCEAQETTTQEQAIAAARATVIANTTYTKGPSGVLHGVNCVSVLIETLPPSFNGLVTKDDIKTAIELRCRSFGLRVAENDDTAPMLYLNVGAVKIGDLGYAYNLALNFEENVILARDMKTATLGTVWTSGTTHYGGALRLSATDIKNEVQGNLDKFLNDWLKANGH